MRLPEATAARTGLALELDARHVDALRELLNLGVGRAAAELNDMLDHPIQLQVPNIQILSGDEAAASWQAVHHETMSLVQLPFAGKFQGSAFLGFPPDSATQLVRALVGADTNDVVLDSLQSGTLAEVGNIVLNSVVGSIANLLETNLVYSIPSYFEDSPAKVLRWDTASDATVLMAGTRFCVDALDIEGDVQVVFALNAFENLLVALDELGT